MKFRGSLYVIKDREITMKFYKELFGLRVIQDFGANFTMTGGLSFQTVESWCEFIDKTPNDITFGANNAEMYFETEDIDNLLNILEKNQVNLVHPLKQHSWGQRGIRFYDPDQHIIEVSETLQQVCLRYFNEGLSIAEIAEKTLLSEKIVQRFLK